MPPLCPPSPAPICPPAAQPPDPPKHQYVGRVTKYAPDPQVAEARGHLYVRVVVPLERRGPHFEKSLGEKARWCVHKLFSLSPTRQMLRAVLLLGGSKLYPCLVDGRQLPQRPGPERVPEPSLDPRTQQHLQRHFNPSQV